MTYKSRLTSAAVLALFADGGAAAQTVCDPNEETPGVTDTEILIGTTMPLSGSGAVAGIGTRDGAQAYYDMINAQGGVKGRQISYTVLDDEYAPARAQAQMRSLIQRDGIFLVAGGEGTPNFLGVVPFLEREGIPAIAPYSPSSELGTMETPHIFMTAVDYITQFEIMTEFVIENYQPASLALVGVQGNVGDDSKAGMERAIGDQDIPLTYIPEVPGTPDLTPIATQLREAGADWTFLILTNTDTGQLLQAMRRIGYEPRTAAWAGMDDADYIEPFGDVSQGMIVAEETAHLESEDPMVREAHTLFEQQTGEQPTKFNQLGWVQAQIAVEAMNRAEALTRSCVMAALEGMTDYRTGILPPINWGPNERQGVRDIGLVEIQGDTTVEVKPFAQAE